MTRIFWWCGLILLAGQAALAVPAPPFPIQLQNTDGTTVTGVLKGDEFLSWAEDLDGFSMVIDLSDGAWHYATLDRDGRLVPTGHRAGQSDPKALGLPRHLRPGETAVRRILEQKKNAVPVLGVPEDWSGDIPNLVLLVKFANRTSHFTPADFGPVYNGASGSVQDYYQEVSYGKWHFVSTVHDWIPLSQNDDYYVYNAQNPYGHPEEMIKEAVAYLDQQNFDFTKFDSNHDGIIDAVDVIHCGQGFEYSGNPNDIHSHFLNMQQYGMDFYTHDNIHIVAYHTEPEYRSDGVQITQIGVICHESAHFFGLPDLYDYNYASGGVGLWCLLSMGPWAGPNMDGTVPVHLSAWGKAKLGFVTPTHLQASASNQTLHPAESTAESVRLDYNMPSQQYFILEDRQQTQYDQYIPGGGLLIYHVDESQTDENNPNDYLVDVEQADGQRDLNTNAQAVGDASDPYPYSANNAFTPKSNPNSIAYGQSSSKISVLNIARSGSNVTFDVFLGDANTSSLAVNPNQLSFVGSVGGTDPASQSLSLTHLGASDLSWTVAPQAAWLHAAPGFGTTPSQVQVSVSLSGLSPGSYGSSLRFTAPNASNSPLDVVVQLQVADVPPAFDVNPLSLTFQADTAGNASPQSIQIQNSGGGTLAWTATTEGNWYSLSASAGTAPSTLTVTPHATGMAAGNYSGAVNLGATGLTPVRVTLALTIPTPAVLAVNPASLAIQGSVGGAPQSSTLSVANTGSGAMNWTVSSTPGWLSCSPAAGSGSGSVTVTASPSGLAEGTYQGSVTVTASGAQGSPAVVPVQFLVSHALPPAPVLLSPTDGAEIDSRNPDLTLQNVVSPDGQALTYTFEVFASGSSTPYATISGVPAGSGGITSVNLQKTLDIQASYLWHAQAVSAQGSAGPFSAMWSFNVIAGGGGGCGCATGQNPDAGVLLGVLLAGLFLMQRRGTGLARSCAWRSPSIDASRVRGGSWRRRRKARTPCR